MARSDFLPWTSLGESVTGWSWINRCFAVYSITDGPV